MATVFPVPPPTTNTLDPAQRKRLLKSTQKLGALLGTTPRVLEPGTAFPPPLTPGTRAFRREGKVFHNHSASSSMTSLSSLEQESYVWVPSPAEMVMKHHKNASTPITIEFPLSSSGKAIPSMAEHKRSRSSQQHSTTVPQQLSQPLLYRLRSVPIPPPAISPTFTQEKTLPPILPLSPISPIFDAPAKTSMKPRGQKQLSEGDRRRKMAKLARTLGENIPQELVFGPPPRSTSLRGNTMATVTTIPNAPAAPTISRRKRSVTGTHRPPTLASPPKSQSPTDNIPPVPVQPAGKTSIPRSSSGTFVNTSPAAPKHLPPTPVITVTTTTSTTAISSTTTTTTGATTTTTATPAKRRHRPRSLTLTHIPVGRNGGIVVEQDKAVPETGRPHSRSLDELERVSVVRRKETGMAAVSASMANLADFGRRKEREWSGEWNVKDMEDVVKALRGLRVR